MKIAVVSGFPPDPYGEAHYSGQAFCAMAKAFPKVEIFIFAHITPNSPSQEQILSNLQVRRVTVPGNRIKATFAMLPLTYHLLRLHPSVVHFQGTHTSHYGGLWGEPITGVINALRVLGIPSIMTVHSTWMPTDLNDFAQNKNLGQYANKTLRWYYRAFIRSLAHSLSYMNILSAGDSSPITFAYSSEWGIENSYICNEPHPCTYDPISQEMQRKAKEQLGLTKQQVVLAMGFVRPDKGYHTLLECASRLLTRHSDTVIIIAGQPRGKDIESYIGSLKRLRLSSNASERIWLRFEYLSEEDLNLLFCASDIVTVPYLRVIGASGPVHHALGRGKPVIASAIGHNLGLADVCKLVPPGDALALGEAIDELLSQPQLLEDYRRRSIEYASRHTWEHLAQQYITQYREMLA